MPNEDVPQKYAPDSDGTAMSAAQKNDLLRRTVSELANAINPLASSPSAPLETQALVDAFGPSLMPRATMHQGMASGLAVLSAGAVNAPLHWVATQLAPPDSPLALAPARPGRDRRRWVVPLEHLRNRLGAHPRISAAKRR